jgi:hypothetical protein
MQTEGDSEYRHWDFIEDGDLEWHEATQEEQIHFREVAAAFLRTTFNPPAGYVIDVLEAQYAQSRLPVIALGWNHDPEPLSVNERQEFIRRMVEPLNRFVRAVDWREVARIRADANTAPGVEDLTQLLKRHTAALPLAQRCWEAMSDAATAIGVAPRSVSAAKLRDIHAKREDWAVVREKAWGRTVESSEALVPALARMADAGDAVCVHSVRTKAETFFIFTDAALERLVVIQAIRDDRSR